jgi:hypothetical protein
MMDLTTCSLLLVLFLLLLWGGKLSQDKLTYQSLEKFRNQEPTKGNPFAHLLGMNRYREVKDGECCDVWPAGPIVPATCNRVPLYPDGLEPTRDIPDEVAIPEAPFDNLAPKDGKFTFGIPELRYDGIWTKKANPGDPAQCCWTLAPPKNCELKTYGASHLSRIPKCSMFGKTIVEPPECAGLWPGGPPPITLIYDCHENVPCSVRRNIPCPTRV